MHTALIIRAIFFPALLCHLQDILPILLWYPWSHDSSPMLLVALVEALRVRDQWRALVDTIVNFRVP
jgi:hypothetical protein